MPAIDSERERIQDDLRGLIAGEIRCDDLFVQLYASDASIYEIRPLGVVRPRSTKDVVTCIQYAAEKGIPIHARGAGTGSAGESLGPGLVLDFSRYLRRIIDDDGCEVRIQPGLVHERLNAYLGQRGRLFGPDPATSVSTTMGSVIATDGSGSHWLKYGSARQHVRALQVVLADGTEMELGREPLVLEGHSHGEPRKRGLVEGLGRLLEENRETIRRCQPEERPTHCGYRLGEALTDRYVDFVQLLAGSEGTLAVITEAVVETQPLPRHRGVALLLFDGMEKAARAVHDVLPHGVSACDLMDRRHLSLAREADVRFDLLLPPMTEAVLLVEQDGDQSADVRQRLHEVVGHVRDRRGLAFGSRQAFDPVEVELFWSLATRIQPGLYRLKGSTRPVPGMEDLAVPPEVLTEFLLELQNVLKRHEVIASFFCHTGQGELHIRPFLDLADPADVTRMRKLADDLCASALRFGGAVGAERGCGLSRTPFLRRQDGELYDVFRRVKQLFDPHNLLNPGKVIGDDPDLLTKNIRPLVAAPPKDGQENGTAGGATGMRDLVELQLNWDPGQVADVARTCNGCGECRSQAPEVRMCPMFRILPAEESSPRAKANLLHGVLTGQLDLSQLTSNEFRKIADLCIHCHMCAQECPAKVDIPKLMLEAKGAYVAANGLRPRDWVMAHLDLFSAVGSRISPVSNWAVENRPMRWILEKTLGIAQGRKLPRFTSRPFLRRAARRRLTRPARRIGNKVAYFVDTYANYHDPHLAEALVAVLEHNGVSVFVPPEQKQAGMSAVALGALDVARRLAEHNTSIFADAVRQGCHVLATEPAVVVCLQREYPGLLDDEDVRLVAENSSEACTYLWRMHTQGRLQLDFKPINVRLAYHAPCRLKALRVGTPGEDLLNLIPGLTVEHIEEGCSGMAGTFGLRRENYRTSLRIGRCLISRLRSPTIQAGTTECSTCKFQMEQGTTMPTVHPIKLLALAYGLMPGLAPLLTAPGKELMVT